MVSRSSVDCQSTSNSDTICRTLYISIPLYLCGFLVLGAALQNHLHIAVIVVGWGIAQIADLMCAVAVCEYKRTGLMVTKC